MIQMESTHGSYFQGLFLLFFFFKEGKLPYPAQMPANLDSSIFFMTI
jgi:hypothetical protein